MLLKDFYTPLSSTPLDETCWSVLLELNPEHAIYRGHFPKHPVVPGVCLLQLVKESAEHICRQRLQYTQVSSCKFLSAVNPSETPQLSFTLTLKNAEDGNFLLLAEGAKQHEPFIKLKALLTPKP